MDSREIFFSPFPHNIKQFILNNNILLIIAAEFLKFHCIRFHFYEGESLLLYIIYFILKFITAADVTKN